MVDFEEQPPATSNKCFAGSFANVGGSISKDVVSPFEAYFGQVEFNRGLPIFLSKPWAFGGNSHLVSLA